MSWHLTRIWLLCIDVLAFDFCAWCFVSKHKTPKDCWQNLLYQKTKWSILRNEMFAKKYRIYLVDLPPPVNSSPSGNWISGWYLPLPVNSPPKTAISDFRRVSAESSGFPSEIVDFLLISRSIRTPNVQAPRLVYLRRRPVCIGADRSTCEISSPIEILVWSGWPTWSTSGAQHNQNNIYNHRPVCCFVDQFACFAWTSL